MHSPINPSGVATAPRRTDLLPGPLAEVETAEPADGEGASDAIPERGGGTECWAFCNRPGGTVGRQGPAINSSPSGFARLVMTGLIAPVVRSRVPKRATPDSAGAAT